MIIPTGQPNAGTYFYHLDAQGSVIALSKFDTTVKVVEKYTYSAFGQAVIHSPGSDGIWGNGDDDNTLTASAYGSPYQYTSRRWDPETGLYDYRARMYDPVLGRFMQTDPIGYYDSLNLYTYCGNNPINWNDPYGLCKSTWLDKFQVGLDIVGMFEPFGIADGVNGIIHLARGNRTDALMSFAGILPFGDLAKVGKYAVAGAGLFFIARYGDEVAAVAKHSDSLKLLPAPKQLKALPAPKIVIGENMNRVKAAAKDLNAEIFTGKTMAENVEWIRLKKGQGYEIHDIGPDFVRRAKNVEKGIRPDSIFYNMERMETKGANIIKHWERQSKFAGSSPWQE